MSKASEDVLLFKGFNQGMLVLVRHEIAALGIGAHLQSIEHLVRHSLVAHSAPECSLIRIRSPAGLFSLAFGRDGLIRERSGSRTVKLQIQRFLTLQPLDFLAHADHVGFHLVIGGAVLGGQGAVRVLAGFHKRLGGLPQLDALFAHGADFIH